MWTKCATRSKSLTTNRVLKELPHLEKILKKSWTEGAIRVGFSSFFGSSYHIEDLWRIFWKSYQIMEFSTILWCSYHIGDFSQSFWQICQISNFQEYFDGSIRMWTSQEYLEIVIRPWTFTKIFGESCQKELPDHSFSRKRYHIVDLSRIFWKAYEIMRFSRILRMSYQIVNI